MSVLVLRVSFEHLAMLLVMSLPSVPDALRLSPLRVMVARVVTHDARVASLTIVTGRTLGRPGGMQVATYDPLRSTTIDLRGSTLQTPLLLPPLPRPSLPPWTNAPSTYDLEMAQSGVDPGSLFQLAQLNTKWVIYWAIFGPP
ncbi:hypothetical protein BDK51DRAFT_51462 [Blyttiomyces helicus]|uniref:Secreted protein n=1 Tax=Blyttiomyces helicus TaxID=388810 RepID=A0A4V1IQI0_9FUNG|nr:hypothetical protein BDK51DRAFT_51462 [Blyttiomyces helicus]|eukprot:RKO86627.1 hypothetical protein BDK51DRAFT_51462 [Blyttiomyces helicus]